MRDDPYNNDFFQVRLVLSCKGTGTDDHYSQSSHTSLPLSLRNPSHKHRLWNVFFMPLLFRSPANESIPLKTRLQHRFFARHASNSPLQAPASSEPTEPELQGKEKVGAEGGDEGYNVDVESLYVSPV
jgi:hypothetical protein